MQGTEAERIQHADSAARFVRAAAAQGCECGRAEWRVEHTEGRVRYVKCRSCGRRQKIVAD